MFDPAQQLARAAADRQARAESVLSARRQRMAERWFTPQHTWVAMNGETATIGITDHAAQMLLDIVYMSLPSAGTRVSAGERCGQVESVKAISDLYAPVDGTVTQINELLDITPGLVNDEPDGAHCKADGDPAGIAELYDGVPGDEEAFTNGSITFRCKRLK